MAGPRISNREKDRKYTLREVLISLGRVSGATMEEVATQCGVTVRALYYDMAAEGIIDELSKYMQPLVKHKRRDIKEIAASMVDKELEKLAGPAVAAIEDILTGGGDPKTAAENAWRVVHQLRGTPASTYKLEKSVSGTVRHEHYVMPGKTLVALGEDIERDAELMRQAKQLTAPSDIPAMIGVEDRAKAITVDAT